MQQVDSYSSSSDFSAEEPSSWISWHCEQPENMFLCEVDYQYIESAFNLFGLKNEVNHFAHCRDIIVEELETSTSDCSSGVPLAWENEGSAELYGRIHVRYLNTLQGQRAMADKFMRGHFGNCPLYKCNNQKVLPIGMSDIPGQCPVKVYCPRCQDIYDTPKSNLDGAFFGRTFVPFLLMCMPELIPNDGARLQLSSSYQFTPTIFGFGIHKSSPYWQRRKIPRKEVEAHHKAIRDKYAAAVAAQNLELG